MYIKDIECTKDTPVILGCADTPVYGKGRRIKPKVKGREDSEHFKKIYLPELLPLEEYDLVIVLCPVGRILLHAFISCWSLGCRKKK